MAPCPDSSSRLKTFHCRTTEETENLADTVCRTLKPGMVVGLKGELGTGKSVFVRAAARALGVQDRMPSPTYTIVEEYEGAEGPILHIDVYRLGGSDEFEMLGLEEQLSESISFVEWIDRVPELERRCDLHVSIKSTGPDERTITIAGRYE